MTLYAEMVAQDGKILWSHEAAIKSDDKTLPSILPEDLRNNPEEQEKLLRIAAHRASEKVMESYKEKQNKEKPRMDSPSPATDKNQDEPQMNSPSPS